MSKVDALVISTSPYVFATRPRKAADSYAARGTAVFLSLQGVGRTGKRDNAGTQVRGDLTIVQVPVRSPAQAPTRLNVICNLILCYLPGFLRLAIATGRTRASVVHVTGAPLLLLGLLHKFLHRSRLVVDINERPNSVRAEDSVFGLVSRAEPALLRLGARKADVCTVVTPGHATILESEFGFHDVLTVLNAPLQSWRAQYAVPVPIGVNEPLRVVTVGTLFERRGFELLIDAVRLTLDADCPVHLDIYGGGRNEYVDALAARIVSVGVSDAVRLRGRIDSSRVSATYLTGHVGLALYEPSDAGNDSLSNKLIECVSTGRPVIAGNLSENARFLSAHKVGWLSNLTARDLSNAFQTARRVDLVAMADECRRVGDRELSWEAEFAEVHAALDAVRGRLR